MQTRLVLFAAFFFSPSSHALPDGYCQVGCKGGTPVPAFNFAKKLADSGDPNGGPAKDTTLIPGDEGGAPEKSTKTGDLLANLKSVEDWSAASCGKSINDDSWDTIEVVAPCEPHKALLDRMAKMIIGQHSKNGTPPPTKETGNAFFNVASSAAAQKNLEDQWYCRHFKAGDPNGAALNSTLCKPWDMTLGKTGTVAAGIKAESCRNVSSPNFVPEKKFNVGDGFIGCRKGLPPGSRTSSKESFNAGVWVLGKSFPLLATSSSQNAPYKATVSHSSTNQFMGKSLCPKSASGVKVEYDENCPAYKLHEGTSATFSVGPIPITVEAGAEGQLGINHYSRVAPMWSNGRADPYLQITGYASAYVNLVIAKGGVEANLLILSNVFDAYGFAGVAWLPKSPNLQEGFYFSEHLSGIDKLNALSGNIAAFAKIPVPKFIGWKWKKYRYTIFSWNGLAADGYVYNQLTPPTPIVMVK